MAPSSPRSCESDSVLEAFCDRLPRLCPWIRGMPLRFSMLLLAGLAAALIVVSLVSVWQTRTLHEAELKRQLAADAAAPRGAVVLLGDSIFEGLDTTALTPGALNF